MSAFDRIIGYEQTKRELMQISDILRHYEYYEKFGVACPKGLLLYGKPGVGKTLMAECLIEDSERTMFICRKDKARNMFVEDIKATFEEAKKCAPSIILLDDMDKFSNEDERQKNTEEYVTVQSCIDDLKGASVYVIATVNNRRTLPDSLIRAGRFDKTIEVCVPRGEEANEIIRHYLQNKKVNLDINIKTVTRIMEGASCAELESVINEAALYAGYERSETIEMRHFVKASMQIIYRKQLYENDENNLGVYNEYAQTVYHEAGHVVVSEILRAGSVAFVALVQSRESVAGTTICHIDTSMPNLEEMKKSIMIRMAGKAASEYKWGNIDSGSKDDIQCAFKRLKEMFGELCVGGFQYYSNEYEDSEQKTANCEQAITLKMEEYYQKARAIVTRNQEFLDKVACELHEKKFLTELDIRRIREQCNIILTEE